MKKRILGLFLLLTMIIQCFPVNAAKNMGYIWPVPGYYMTSSYTGTTQNDHSGIDIATSGVAANVYAAKSGTIMVFYNDCEHISQKTSCNDGIGNGMMIDHGDGTYTQYAHMTLNSFPSNIYAGAHVEQGQLLGQVGSSGMSTGYHLHFEIRTGSNSSYWRNTPVNPMDYVDSDDVIVTEQPADLGTDFYAFIINTAAWRHLTNDCDNVSLRLETDADTQKWHFLRQTDGSYKIVNLHDSKCLEVASASTENGANVQVFTDNNTDAQRWYIIDKSNGKYALQSKIGDKVIDLPSGVTDEGTNVQMWQSNDSDAQKYSIYIIDNAVPQWATLKTNKSTYHSTETIYITSRSDFATIYYIIIFRDGSIVFQGNIPSDWVCSFVESGNYSAYVTASNKTGHLDTNWVDFSVITSEPFPTANPTPDPTPAPTATPTATPTPKPTTAPTPVPAACFTVTQSSGYAEVQNTSAAAQTATVIVAKYDGELLKSVSSVDVTFAAGEKRTFMYDSDGTYKVFVWNSLGGMLPLNK